jgi:Na+-driven multidrug efflux pump
VTLYQTVIASLIHWTIAFSTINYFENKMTGLAIASSVQFIVRMLVAVTYAFITEDTRRGLLPMSDPESSKDLKEIFVHGANSFLLRVMGWWAFDVFTWLAGTLPTEYLGGQTILRNIGLFTYMIPVGLSSAANILVGKYVGKNRVDLAVKIKNQVMITTFIWSVL